MHSFAECPLRTFCSLTTTNDYPFHILHVDNAALDLFLASPSSLHPSKDEDDPLSDPAVLAHHRSEAMRYLRGKPVAEILVSDLDSCNTSTASTTCNNSIQSFIISEQTVLTCRNTLETSLIARYARHVHGCIHTSVPYFPSSSSSSLSTPSDSVQEQLQDQHMSRSLHHNTLSRVYVLKDVTEIHNLAHAIQTDLQREFLPRSNRSPRSSMSSARGTLPSKDRRETASRNSRQKPYSTEDGDDWTIRASSSLSSSSSEHALAQRAACPKDDLLLLHVTRFGTIDHAFVMPDPLVDYRRSSYYNATTHAARNTAVMSYAHPDDIQTLCRGLDRICKSRPATFRIRWRVQRQKHESSDPCTETPNMEKRGRSWTTTPTVPSRTIEFKGESFEEWFDPTAVSNPASLANAQAQCPQNDDENYFWAEVRGIQSRGQPLLVVRPLTAQELQRQREHRPRSTSHLTPARRTRPEEEQDSLPKAKEWKKVSKKMGMEEGIKLPNPLNLSALTSLKDRPLQQHQLQKQKLQEASVRTPGSFPVQHLQSSPLSVSCCRISGPGNSMGPTLLTFKVPTSRPPWTIFITVALDAWKQWIHTVHLGQAQFHDWCEYVIDITLDQMIDSVFWGLTFMGVEGRRVGPRCVGTLEQQADEQAEETISRPCGVAHQEHSMEAWIDMHLDLGQQQQPQLTQGHPALSSIHRVGQILHNYPNLEGVVLGIGNSWIGRKIKHRLEHKLEAAADHIFNGWSWCSGVETAIFGLSSSTGSATESSTVRIVEMTEDMRSVPVMV